MGTLMLCPSGVEAAEPLVGIEGLLKLKAFCLHTPKKWYDISVASSIWSVRNVGELMNLCKFESRAPCSKTWTEVLVGGSGGGESYKSCALLHNVLIYI